MWNKFDRPLLLEPGSSWYLLSAGALLYSLAVIAWLLSPASWMLTSVMLLALVGHFFYYYRHYIKRSSPKSIQSIGWDREAGWKLQMISGFSVEVVLQPPVLVTSRLVAVRFYSQDNRFPRRYRHLIVAQDSLDADAFRRLRVRLLQSAT